MFLCHIWIQHKNSFEYKQAQYSHCSSWDSPYILRIYEKFKVFCIVTSIVSIVRSINLYIDFYYNYPFQSILAISCLYP